MAGLKPRLVLADRSKNIILIDRATSVLWALIIPNRTAFIEFEMINSLINLELIAGNQG